MLRATILLIFFLGASIANPIDSDSNYDPRIVGGLDAEPGQFPFAISLRSSFGSHICGGSIIGLNWVITAAHCVAGGKPSAYTVVAGLNQLNSSTATRLAITDITVHPKWDPVTISNDVAVLKLASPIQLSKLIEIVDLESENAEDPRECTIVGWGRTAANGPIPNDLQYLESKTISYDDCARSWASVNPVFETEICTFTERGEGACNGDSGGPLICKVNGKVKLCGLVSWGYPCALGKPDVYTRVSSFYEWIYDIISK